jgi:IS30 family transposase
MGNKCKQIILEEREEIYVLRRSGKSFREIAGQLGRSHRTIAREYNRNRRAGQDYIPCRAQVKAQTGQKEQRVKAALKNHEIFLYVGEKLRESGWSPETIAAKLKQEHPGQSIHTETIYRYIYGKGKRYKLWEYLP